MMTIIPMITIITMITITNDKKQTIKTKQIGLRAGDTNWNSAHVTGCL